MYIVCFFRHILTYQNFTSLYNNFFDKYWNVLHLAMEITYGNMLIYSYANYLKNQFPPNAIHA